MSQQSPVSNLSSRIESTLVEMVSTCAEGRAAIGEGENCVAAIGKRLMKGTSAGTEHGVAVLWSACYLCRDRTAHDLLDDFSNWVTSETRETRSETGANLFLCWYRTLPRLHRITKQPKPRTHRLQLINAGHTRCMSKLLTRLPFASSPSLTSPPAISSAKSSPPMALSLINLQRLHDLLDDFKESVSETRETRSETGTNLFLRRYRTLPRFHRITKQPKPRTHWLQLINAGHTRCMSKLLTRLPFASSPSLTSPPAISSAKSSPPMALSLISLQKL
ncbi:U-box domain-containing protein 28 [Camellia lanceoleosa]|uniref:U-box domain-containing protein 28 n=1 Tax=Camellia lanceoleosa TaxID=1840588 RepID=A0ACC0GK71_9ERIC|nr:U-box domain-containing protein 28 [Camellia lanceoleosa]